MKLWVIIPVKPLKRAKSRLSDVLSPEQRFQFAEAMLRHILRVVSKTTVVTGTLVISRDTQALAVAREFGVKTVQESGTPELNPALMRATEVVRSREEASAVLILPADLPFITEVDITAIIELAERHPCIVLATDHQRNGTNAMLVRPPGLIEYAYGEGSFQRHSELAHKAGATLEYYESERLLLDIDLPEDLYRYNEIVQSGDYDDLPLFSHLPDNAG